MIIIFTINKLILSLSGKYFYCTFNPKRLQFFLRLTSNFFSSVFHFKGSWFGFSAVILKRTNNFPPITPTTIAFICRCKHLSVVSISPFKLASIRRGGGRLDTLPLQAVILQNGGQGSYFASDKSILALAIIATVFDVTPVIGSLFHLWKTWLMGNWSVERNWSIWSLVTSHEFSCWT